MEGGWKSLKRLFAEVDWSISYVAFLLYFIVVITYRIQGASTFVAVGAACLILEKGRFRVPGWVAMFGAFVLWGVVVYSRSPYSGVAWEQGVVAYSKLWLICLVAANVLNSGPRVRFFLVFFVFLYVTHPIRGALLNTFLYGYTEANRSVWNGAWSNPNDMAALTFLPLGIAAGLLRDRHGLVRKGALAAVAIMPFTIFLTRSRGGFLALAVFSAMTVFSNLRKVKGLILVGTIAVGAILVSPAGTFDRFEAFSTALRGGDVATADEEGSAAQRLEIWRIAKVVIRESPIFGVGLAAYPSAHAVAARLSTTTRTGFGNRDAHSTYLRVTAETGYPGLVIFSLPFLVALIGARVARRKYGKLDPGRATIVRYVEASLVAYLISGIFGSYANTIFLWIHVGLLALVTQDLERAGTAVAARWTSRTVPSPAIAARRERMPAGS